MKKIPKYRKRKIRTLIPGKKIAEFYNFPLTDQSKSLIDLASNDYLNLNNHPALIKAAFETSLEEGVGAGGSRLVTGSRPIHKKLEDELSHWIGREKTVLFPSGFQANIAAVSILANRYTPVIADRLVHNSLLTGIKVSGAKLIRFKHNDLNDLEGYLKKYKIKEPFRSPLVITESLFSMEGTSPNIKDLTKLCKNYNARLLIDEAHAIGVLGEDGRGLCYGVEIPGLIISGTFGKAFGSGGAFIAGSLKFGEQLIQECGAFKYTTALAPPLCAAALAALRLIKSNNSWPYQLQIKCRDWRKRLQQHGWNITAGIGPIIPIIVGDDKKALILQNKLEQDGLLCVAIRPPTVPEGSSRLRLVVRKDLPKITLDKLIACLENQ